MSPGDAEEGNAAVPPGSADHVGGKEAVAAPLGKDAGNGEAKDGDGTEKARPPCHRVHELAVVLPLPCLPVADISEADDRLFLVMGVA